MLAFYIRDAEIKDAIKFMQSLQIFTFAGSLGDVESLVSLP
jgi:cystathionine beta-lyase/cystathionine gamma-synthase